MSLADHYDPERADGGNHLREGRHICQIKSLQFCDANSGNRGVEFTCGNREGDTRITFWLRSASGSGKSPLWKLANFAAACGLSQNQMRRVSPETEVGLEVFVGRDVGIVVVKDEQGYHNGDSFFALGDKELPPAVDQPPMTPPPVQQPAPVAAFNDAGLPISDDDDLPF